MSKQLFLGLLLMCAALLAGCGGAPNAPSNTTAAPTPAPRGSVQVTSTPTATDAVTPGVASTIAPPSATPAVRTQQPATPAAVSGNPFDVLTNAMLAQLNAKAYRSRGTITQASGKSTTTLVEYVDPDRVHLVSSSGLEFIVIKGEGSWQKVGGKWSKSAVDMSATVFAFRDPKTIEELRNTIISQQVNLIGPDLLDGKPMLVYNYTTLLKGSGPEGSIRGAYKMWIGAADSLPYRLEGESDSIITKGEKTKSLTIYEYDSSIKIEKPI